MLSGPVRAKLGHAIARVLLKLSSAKLGVPKFREQISSSRVTNVAPFPNEVARKLYAERAEDMDSIR